MWSKLDDDAPADATAAPVAAATGGAASTGLDAPADATAAPAAAVTGGAASTGLGRSGAPARGGRPKASTTNAHTATSSSSSSAAVPLSLLEAGTQDQLDKDEDEDEEEDAELFYASAEGQWLSWLCGVGARAQLWSFLRYELLMAIAAVLVAIVGAVVTASCRWAPPGRCVFFGGPAGSWIELGALSIAVSIPARVADKLLFSVVQALSAPIASETLNTAVFYFSAFEGSVSRIAWIGLTWSAADAILDLPDPWYVERGMLSLLEVQLLAVAKNLVMRIMLRNVLISSFSDKIQDVLFAQLAVLVVTRASHGQVVDGKLVVPPRDGAQRELTGLLQSPNFRRKLDVVSKLRFRMYDKRGRLVPVGSATLVASLAKHAVKSLSRLPASALVELDVYDRAGEEIKESLFATGRGLTGIHAPGGGAGGGPQQQQQQQQQAMGGAGFGVGGGGGYPSATPTPGVGDSVSTPDDWGDALGSEPAIHRLASNAFGRVRRQPSDRDMTALAAGASASSSGSGGSGGGGRARSGTVMIVAERVAEAASSLLVSARTAVSTAAAGVAPQVSSPHLGGLVRKQPPPAIHIPDSAHAMSSSGEESAVLAGVTGVVGDAGAGAGAPAAAAAPPRRGLTASTFQPPPPSDNMSSPHHRGLPSPAGLSRGLSIALPSPALSAVPPSPIGGGGGSSGPVSRMTSSRADAAPPTAVSVAAPPPVAAADTAVVDWESAAAAAGEARKRTRRPSDPGPAATRGTAATAARGGLASTSNALAGLSSMASIGANMKHVRDALRAGLREGLAAAAAAADDGGGDGSAAAAGEAGAAAASSAAAKKAAIPPLTPGHFAACIEADATLEVGKVFSLFDLTGSGLVSREDFIAACSDAWASLRALKYALDGHQSTVTALAAVLNTAYAIVVAFAVSLTFEVPVVEVFVPLGTVIVSLSFAVGASVSNVVSSLIFVLIMRPYDVGDRVTASCVMNGEETLIVKRIDVLTTTFLRIINKELTVPNFVLASCPGGIENFKRSPPALMRLDIAVSIATTALQLEGLRRRTNAYLETQPLAWKPTCTIRALSLRDQSIVLAVFVQSRWTYQEAPRLYKANFALWLHLLAAMRDLGISFRAPDQAVRIEGNLTTSLPPQQVQAAVGAVGGAAKAMAQMQAQMQAQAQAALLAQREREQGAAAAAAAAAVTTTASAPSGPATSS
jgi:small-conductance mechanosensitive channel